MMYLIDRSHRRMVHTTCIQPLMPLKRKKLCMKVHCVTKNDSYSLLVSCLMCWAAIGVLFVRWWVG